MSKLTTNESYKKLLADIKQNIVKSQQRAVVIINQEMLILYWKIGVLILERQQQDGWGAQVVEQLSKDLKMLYPEMKGFSTRNLKYMRLFSKEYPDFEKVQQLVAQIGWLYNLLLVEKFRGNYFSKTQAFTPSNSPSQHPCSHRQYC